MLLFCELYPCYASIKESENPFSQHLLSPDVCRNCIGQQFAMLELKVAIALILLRFKVTAASPTPLLFLNNVILQPKNGIHLHLQKLPECPILKHNG